MRDSAVAVEGPTMPNATIGLLGAMEGLCRLLSSLAQDYEAVQFSIEPRAGCPLVWAPSSESLQTHFNIMTNRLQKQGLTRLISSKEAVGPYPGLRSHTMRGSIPWMAPEAPNGSSCGLRARLGGREYSVRFQALNRRCLPETIIAVPNIETLNTVFEPVGLGLMEGCTML